MLAVTKRTMLAVLVLSVVIVPVVALRSQEEESLLKTLSDKLATQETAWNQCDLPGFMGAYWKSEKLTFSAGGTTQRGWNATLARYQSRYPDRATMGTLTFSELEVQSLGEGAALMLGRWSLERDEPAKGNFSLVWQKIDGRWLIVHDHSSSEEE